MRSVSVMRAEKRGCRMVTENAGTERAVSSESKFIKELKQPDEISKVKRSGL